MPFLTNVVHLQDQSIEHNRAREPFSAGKTDLMIQTVECRIGSD